MRVGFILLLMSSLSFLLSYISLIMRPRNLFPRYLSLSGVLFLVLSFGIFVFACVSHDYSLSYVYNNVSNSLPLIYRLSAVWAGQEGSLLLWTAFTGCACVPMMISGRGRSMSVMPLLLFLFTVSVILFANPYASARGEYQNGIGLNPILENFWMAVHPPILFAGYACTLPLFTAAFAALMKNRWSDLIAPTRRYVLLSAFLILMGNITGGFWAYETLGWGGFWGWDPVENGAFVPLLLLIAFIFRIDSDSPTLENARAGMLVACGVFISVMMSSFMTRSGIFADSSVHSFSASPLGLPFGIISLCACILPIVALKFRSKDDYGFNLELSTREKILSGVLSLVTLYAVLVFTLTVLPVCVSLISGSSYLLKTSIYNDLSIPFAGVFLSAISISRIVSFSRDSSVVLIAGASVSVLVSLAVVVLSDGGAWMSALSVLAVTVIAASILQLIKKRWRAVPSFLLCSGFALFTIGVIVSSQGPSARIELHPASPVSWRGITFEYSGINPEKDKALVVRVSGTGINERMPMPGVPERDSFTHSPLIIRTLVKDYYISVERYISAADSGSTKKNITDAKDALRWETLIVNVSVKPMMMLVWIGLLMLAAGFGWALFSGRRFR